MSARFAATVVQVHRFRHPPLAAWSLLLLVLTATAMFAYSRPEQAVSSERVSDSSMAAHVEAFRIHAMSIPWLVADPRPLGDYGSSLVGHTERGATMARSAGDDNLAAAWDEANVRARVFAAADPDDVDGYRAAAQSLSATVDRVTAAHQGVPLLAPPPPMTGTPPSPSTDTGMSPHPAVPPAVPPSVLSNDTP